MKKFLLSALGLTFSLFMCSCSNSSDINYNNNIQTTETTNTTEKSLETATYEICYRYLHGGFAFYDEDGNLLPDLPSVDYWVGHDYSIYAFGDFTENNFYCHGDSIIVTYDKSTYDKSKEYSILAFPYEVISVERIHTATVERISLDEIVRNENGGISFIGGKETEYRNYNESDALYIMDTSLHYGYLSEYKGDILYRATDSLGGYVYYSFDPTK
jgi:hypothetical protein